MARTRAKKTANPEDSTPGPTPTTSKPLPPSDPNPPKVFILPKDTSSSARVVILDNPATGSPSRYLFCPDEGFYEFTRIAAPRKACRSWLISSDNNINDGQEKETEGGNSDVSIGTGYVTKSLDMCIATPIDTLFFVVPALTPKSAKGTKQHFLCIDDHIEALCSLNLHWKPLLTQHPSLKAMIEKRIAAISDTVDAGDEPMYRISHDKLLSLLLKKAERMSENGLPASMEEKFVKQALHVPVMNIKRKARSPSSVPATEPSTAADPQDTPMNTETQESTASSTSKVTQTANTTPTTSFTSTADEPSAPTLTTPPIIPPLLRLRVSLTYLLTTYLAPTLRTPLQALLKASTTPDFAPLDAHLSAIAQLRAEAAALRSISDNISRKREIDEDEERAVEREEKRRRREDEEQKKKNESRGIKQLKKVDTSGMMKLSSFFAKAPKKT